MMARPVTAATRVIAAAMEQGNQTPTSLALVLESAQLLQSPETAAELERLRSQAASLPVPVGPERLTPQERDMVLGLIEDAKPATSSLLLSFAESVRNRREHDHPKWEDFYCLNLSSYMGERMGPALRRLVDVEAENERLRARVAELEAERHTTNDALADVTLAQRAAEDRPADEYPIRYALTDAAEALPAEDVTPQVQRLRALIAGQRAEAGGAS